MLDILIIAAVMVVSILLALGVDAITRRINR